MTQEPQVASPTSASKGRRTRDRLVDVAAQLFTEKGYQATTFTDLIAAAGLSRGAFYFHFPSKEQLAVAVLEETKRRGLAAVMAQLADAPDALTALRRLAPALLQTHTTDPTVWTAAAIGRELQASAQLRDQAAAVAQEWVGAIAELVRRAQSDGAVRPELDPVDVARLLFAAVEGASTQADALNDPGRREEAFAAQVNLLADLLENGLFVTGPGRNASPASPARRHSSRSASSRKSSGTPPDRANSAGR